MKALYRFTPQNASDGSVTISGSPTLPKYPVSNLKLIQPSRVTKTANASGDKFFLFDAGFGNKITADSLFVNRFNFASFKIQGSDDAFATTPFELAISGLTRDELYDPNTSEVISDDYMSYFATLVAFSYRYLRIFIPAQTPLFEASYFKVGNILFGNAVTLRNPMRGFRVTPVSQLNRNDFPSGYQTVKKLGKTYRVFDGTFDKIPVADYVNIVQTFNPFVLFIGSTDFLNDPQKAYLVRAANDYSRGYETATDLTVGFSFREQV